MPLRGEVIETGPGIQDIPMEIKVGEFVMYKKDAIIAEIDGMELIHQDAIIQVESFDKVEPFDEQGCCKRIGVIGDRWQINKDILQGNKIEFTKYPETPDGCYLPGDGEVKFTEKEE